jgi:VanZ family protein
MIAVPPPVSLSSENPAPSAAGRFRFTTRFAWVIALAATIITASSQSRIATPVEVDHSDKIVHALAFGLLATLLYRSWPAPPVPRRWAIWTVIWVSLFGVTDELHQSFTLDRQADVLDWVADTVGALLAIGVYTRLAVWRRFLETRVPGRAGPLSARSGIAPVATEADVRAPNVR